MLENSLTDEEKSGDKRNGVLQRDTQNYMVRAGKEHRSLKENGNEKRTHISNQKQMAEVSWNDYEEVGFGEFDAHRTDQRQKGQKGESEQST